MHEQNQISNNTQSSNDSSFTKYIIIILVVLIVAFLGLILFMLYQNHNSANSNEPSLDEPSLSISSQGLTQTPTQELVIDNHHLLVQIEKDGVERAIGFYTINGRLEDILQENNTHVLTIRNHLGEIVIGRLEITRSEIPVIEEINSNSSEPTTIDISDLRKDDHIQVDITSNLKTKTVQVTKISKFIE